MEIREFILQELQGNNAYILFDEFITQKNTFQESDITIDFLERLRDYAIERNAKNSVRTYFSSIKSALKKAIKSGYNLPVDADDVTRYLSVGQEASEHIYLTENEIYLIEKYEPRTDLERFVKSVFLLSCYTGCRVLDYAHITRANIIGKEFRYTAEKTKRSAMLPLHPLVPSLIDECHRFNYPGSSVSALVGQVMKRIGEELGINQITTLYQKGQRRTAPKYNFIGAHTARRSFATNCFLDGYEIMQIMRMMGHTNTAQTERYIICGYSDEIKTEKTYLRQNLSAKTTKEKQKKAIIELMAGMGFALDDANKIFDGLVEYMS